MNRPVRSPRRRRRSELTPLVPTTMRGLGALAIVGAFIWIGVVSFGGVPFRGYKYIYVSAPQMGNLLKHDPVRIDGARVGQVDSISLNSSAHPRARLQIEPGTRLPSDTRMLIRANGLLGARFVELLPGRSQQDLREGATIQGGPDSISFGIPDVLDTFDGRTRAGLGQMVNELGKGLLSRGGGLNEALELAPTGVTGAQRVASAILARSGAAERLIPSLGSAATPLAANRDTLSALPGVAADAIKPIGDEQVAVRQTLEQAPPALSAAKAGLASGDRLLVSVTGLARRLARTLPHAPAGLRGATKLLKGSAVPLARTQRLLSAVSPAVPAALKITDSLPPLLGPLHQAVDNLSPMLLEISRYGCDVKNWGAVMRSMDEVSGQGEGPIGWVGEFRAQATILSPGATFGVNDGDALLPRDGYPAPCKYLAKPYPVTHGG